MRFMCVLCGRGSLLCLAGTGTVAAQGCPGHPRREVGSVPKGLAAHAHPLGGWQGSWPGCFHRPLPVPTFTKASQTASSSWGKTWPHTRRRMASSCRGCTESVGEYSPVLGPPACPTPFGQSQEEGGLGVYLWCLASVAFWHCPCAGCCCVNSSPPALLDLASMCTHTRSPPCSDFRPSELPPSVPPSTHPPHSS